MKLKIKCIQNPLWTINIWRVEFNGKVEEFNSNLAAIAYADKLWKRYYKEQAAYSMILTIASNLLAIDDYNFCLKLRQSKCAGITKKQYGYLKGIHERQVREW